MAAQPARLQQLYDAARTIGKQFGRSVQSVFDPCGLILEFPPRPDYSWCTPKSALTFASTGGDGVHYSYLDLPEGTPIVMTMPANDQLNYVVAEGFDEFLGLGFHVGWFSLEQISYQPGWALQYFAAEDTEKDDRKRMLMAALRSALKIQYVALRLARIHALTKKYEVQLQVPAEPP